MEGVAAAQSLVSNVAQLLGDEFWQLRNVGGEVARLRNELATINALLRMQSEADKDGVDHFVREWMKQLREVGYDAEDCVHLYLFRVRSRQGDRFFVRWKRLLTTCWSRHCLAGDIRGLRALASAINEQHARYGFSLEPLRRRDAASSLGPAAASVRPPLGPADSHHYSHRHDQFVDNKDLAKHLANKVKALGNDEGDKQDQPQPPKVFSIWGIGGLGKTTLALEVCRLLQTEFPCQAQVPVSQTFSGKDLQGLLKRLLLQIALPRTTDLLVNIDTTNADEPRTTDLLVNIDTVNADDLERELGEIALPKQESSSPGPGGGQTGQPLQAPQTKGPQASTIPGPALESSKQVDPLGNIDTMDVGQLENKLKESLENRRGPRC